MKRFFTFIVRLSIINFLFYMLAVVFLANNRGVVKPVIQKQNIPVEITQAVNSGNPSQVTGNSTSSTPTPKVTNLFSELQNHNSKSDCWISYSGHIYNITSFFGSHPGGDANMLAYCGKDATAAFDGVPHSGNAKSLLQQYLIQ